MMDTSQYLDVFIDESMEHLDVLYNQLLELENNPDDKSIIEEIFRAAHTLKGMSATMGFQDLANLTHKLENVFDAIRYDKVEVQADIIDVLFKTVDMMNDMVRDIADGGDGKRDVTQEVQLLEQIERGESVGEQTTQAPKPEKTKKNVEVKESSGSAFQFFSSIDEFEFTILEESSLRDYHSYEIFVELSESCLLKGARVFMVFEVLEQLGEIIKSDPTVTDLEEENFDHTFAVLLVSKSPADEIKKKVQKISEIKDVKINQVSLSTYKSERIKKEESHLQQVAATKEDTKQATQTNKQSSSSRQSTARSTIRVNIERLDILMNLFEELVIDRGRLEQIAMELNHSDLRETVERMTRISGDLQNIILNMRMVPVNQVFNRFPGMVRQIARDLKKNIALNIIGAETELDRTVIDEIGDPLVHLIRNAADHGIEMPEERLKKGKPEQGTITLKAYHSGNHVFIDIIDDGAGINKQAVLNKAIQNNVLTPAEAELLTDQQIYELIMASGFSTTEKVSDLSGRGVGLDVVKTTIEKLGGTISIDSKPNEGSIFSIQLPLTLSIISVLLIELQKEKYAIPLSSIIETVIIHKDEILSAHHKKVIDFRGKVIPLVFLNDIFEVPQVYEQDDYVSIVVVKKGDKAAGLVVDSFIGQQEVVLKSLGNYLTDIPAISGATILGDGEVALIIDSNALVV